MNLLKDVKAYYKVDDNIYTELTQEEFVDELDKLCIRLQNRIDKAIEYCDNCIFDYEEDTMIGYDFKIVKYLLNGKSMEEIKELGKDILKGKE